MSATRTIESGEWQIHPYLTDYRAEWPGDMLVERATWTANAPKQQIHAQGPDPITIAGPGYIWFRFWLPEDGQVIERYFNVQGEAVGTYIPICALLEREGNTFRTVMLVLGLWIGADERVTVLHEEEFDAAVASGDITPVQAERAELRIRTLTTAVAQRQFPPGLVRNFTISLGATVDAAESDSTDDGDVENDRSTA